MAKRGALDTFFKPVEKKARTNESHGKVNPTTDALSTTPTLTTQPASTHHTYPFPIPHLPPELVSSLEYSPASSARLIHNQPDLDLAHYTPFIPPPAQKHLFRFLRAQLPFYRVKYKIKRGDVETEIKTPRYTTVFGVDESSTFAPDGVLIDKTTGQPAAKRKYSRNPRPIPESLDALRRVTEGVTGECFNFCLVNFYADGNDSISYHSDDEAFLGKEPCIVSFSLGGNRDFLMKHKTDKNLSHLKLAMRGGDCVVTRGRTQACWLHSVPKRKGVQEGRINITLRKAMSRGGTDNYYHYNVGAGPVYQWNGQEMVISTTEAGADGETRSGVKDEAKAERSEG